MKFLSAFVCFIVMFGLLTVPAQSKPAPNATCHEKCENHYQQCLLSYCGRYGGSSRPKYCVTCKPDYDKCMPLCKN